MKTKKTRLVQARLSTPLADWVEKRAESAGRSVRNYVEHLITLEKKRICVDAWWVYSEDIESLMTTPLDTKSHKRQFVLERLSSKALLDNSEEFKVLNTGGKTYIKPPRMDSPIMGDLYKGAFVLEDDHPRRVWKVGMSFANCADKNRWRLVLKSEFLHSESTR